MCRPTRTVVRPGQAGPGQAGPGPGLEPASGERRTLFSKGDTTPPKPRRMGVQVRITGENEVSGIRFYSVLVNEDDCQWMIRRRYNEFQELDTKLSSYDRFERLPLPAKGLCGFRHRFNVGSFNDDRRFALAQYLSYLVRQVTSTRDDKVLGEFLRAAGASEPKDSQSLILGEAAIPALRESCDSGIKEEPFVRCADPSLPQKALSAPIRKVASLEGVSSLVGSSSSTAPDRSAARQPSSRSPSGYSTQSNLPPKPSNLSPKQPANTTKRIPRGKLAIDVQFTEETECLCGPEWEVLRDKVPEFCVAIRNCSEIVLSSKRFENEAEVVFRALRKYIIGGRLCDEDKVPGMIHVWEFIILFGASRPFMRKRAEEIILCLQDKPHWYEALKSRPDLVGACQQILDCARDMHVSGF